MDKDIIRLPKGADTEIVVRVDDFGGRKGITIREFVKSERYTGFTKAGTRIPADQFKSFKDAINSIDEEELAKPAESQSQPRPQKTFSSDGSGKSGYSFKGKPASKKVEDEENFDDIAF